MSGQAAPIMDAPPLAPGHLGGPALAIPAAPAVVVQKADRSLLRCLQLMLVAAIPLQRFGLSLGDAEIALGLAVSLGCVGWLALSGRLRIDIHRLALLGIVVAAASASAALHPSQSSASSLALFIVLYTPFVFVTSTDRATFLDSLLTFQGLVSLCAVLGIVQFFAQFLLHSPQLFTFQGLLPDGILLHNFNIVVPLRYGSSIFKSNGFFFLEPSIFSQYTALAVLVELLFFRSRLRLALFAVSLVFSYSGTGLLLLAVFLPMVIIYRRAVGIMAIGVAAAVLLVAFGDLWHMDVLLQRLGEFHSTQSSGFARFLSAFWLLRDYILDDTLALLFGRGPGSISAVLTQVSYVAHDPTWGKLLFEYGVVGTAAFALFFLACIFPESHSAGLSGFLLFGFLFFGGMLLDPRLNALLLVFCTLQSQRADPAKADGIGLSETVQPAANRKSPALN